jgi:hypothetical protein
VEGGITSKFCDFFHQLPKVQKLSPTTLTGSQNLSYTARLRSSPTRLLAEFKKAGTQMGSKAEKKLNKAYFGAPPGSSSRSSVKTLNFFDKAPKTVS